MKISFNFFYIFHRLKTITELDSTGTLLSDLSCFSKSEDDLDTSMILQQSKKKREWKEHRPSGEYSAKKRRSTVKTTDLNSSDRIIATTTVTMPKDGNITASSIIETVPADENNDPQTPAQSSRKRRKSEEARRSKSARTDANDVPIVV